MPIEQYSSLALPRDKRAGASPRMAKWYDPSVLWAGAKGFGEGAKGGISQVANAYGLGIPDRIGLTNSSQYQGKDYDASRMLAMGSAIAMPIAGMARGAGMVGKGVQTAAATGRLGKAMQAVRGSRVAHAAAGPAQLASFFVAPRPMAYASMLPNMAIKAMRGNSMLRPLVSAIKATRLGGSLARGVNNFSRGANFVAGQTPGWASKAMVGADVGLGAAVGVARPLEKHMTDIGENGTVVPQEVNQPPLRDTLATLINNWKARRAVEQMGQRTAIDSRARNTVADTRLAQKY